MQADNTDPQLRAYLEQVEAHLRELEPEQRADILQELSDHIADMQAEGISLEAALKKMGAPAAQGRALAAAILDDSPHKVYYAGWVRRTRLLALLPGVLLAVAAVLDYRITLTSHQAAHPFTTLTFLVVLGVALYTWFTQSVALPLWSATWIGISVMLPYALIESVGVAEELCTLLIALISIIAAGGLVRNRSKEHVLLAVIAAVLIALAVVAGIAAFEPGVFALGLPQTVLSAFT